ncbi:hypothetical protein SAMN03159343_3427 [Klenkia marina]|uniref:Uncharacterized protein n=1 Tax=Klenkia marina TaxID=1960309 RepID=A0A1G4YSQ3_9ACTN|nr:hypothetical protein [Klenkia marina]SCX56483.1 hypothetical protein SAMN03159343_3427 [Klenkia marina]
MPDEGQTWGWDQWQAELTAAYLQPSPSTPSTPWAFFLDEAEASRLWPRLDRPAQQLAQCVNARLRWQSPTGLFESLATPWSQWRLHSSAPPPNLPVLAVSVLAAAAMHRDAVANSNAYFLRLAQLLRPELTGDELVRAKDRLAQNFDTVAGWWKDLAAWIAARADEFGESTIRPHPTLTRIGYPLSQSLVRLSDRMRLTHFFAALNIHHLGVPPRPQLVRHLCLWASRPRGLSDAFTRALRHEDLRLLICEHVDRLAHSWDGVVLTARGRQQLDLRVTLDLDEMTAGWAIPVIEGIPELTLACGPSTLTLRAPDWGGLYDIEGQLPNVSSLMDTTVSVSSERYEGSFRFSPLVAFRGHPDAGWISVDSMLPYEKHVLAVLPQHRETVESVLTAAADSSFRQLRQNPDKALIRGRIIFTDVVLTDAHAFESAVNGIQPELVSLLRPDPGPRPQLKNGLPVAQAMGRGHYLEGGAPDLLLPASDKPRQVRAALDGVEQKHPFAATGFPIPLRKLDLEPGDHTLEVDGIKLTFRICRADEIPPARRDPLTWDVTFGHPVAATYRLIRDERSSDGLAGALVPGDVLEPLLLRRGRRDFWLIGRDGRAWGVTPPPPSAVYARHDLPPSQFWELLPPTEAMWVLEVDRRTQQARKPHRLGWIEPHITELDTTSDGLWADIAATWRGTDPILDRYISAWEGKSRAR